MTKKETCQIMDRYLSLTQVRRHSIELDCYSYELLLKMYHNEMIIKQDIKELYAEFTTIKSLVRKKTLLFFTAFIPL